MTKEEARKLRDFIRATRKRFLKTEERVWRDDERLSAKAKTERDLNEVDAHREIGSAINHITDAMEEAARGVQESVYGLRKATPLKSRN